MQLTIDHDSSTPKYQQLVDSVLSAIDKGVWKQGQQLPSVNEIADDYHVARMTVVKAYDELRRRGIIESQHGKGYYVSNTEIKTELNLFVLFDELSTYKEVLYSSFRDALPPNSRANIFFHHHDRYQFDHLIRSAAGRYTHYVIMPHLNTDLSATLDTLPSSQLLLIDCDLPDYPGARAGVFQDFEADIQAGLTAGLPYLTKYRRLNMISPSSPLAYMPDGRTNGFIRFCQQHRIPYRILTGITPAETLRDEAYILFQELPVVSFIKLCRERGWQLGKDIGLISYDDTPYKEIIDNGITVISTDFQQMGRTAAQLLIEKRSEKIHNDCRLIVRGSL